MGIAIAMVMELEPTLNIEHVWVRDYRLSCPRHANHDHHNHIHYSVIHKFHSCSSATKLNMFKMHLNLDLSLIDHLPRYTRSSWDMGVFGWVYSHSTNYSDPYQFSLPPSGSRTHYFLSQNGRIIVHTASRVVLKPRATLLNGDSFLNFSNLFSHLTIKAGHKTN